MIVKVPFSTHDSSGRLTAQGFSLYCLECGGFTFKAFTTEDPTVPIFQCQQCDEAYLISDFTEATFKEVPP